MTNLPRFWRREAFNTRKWCRIIKCAGGIVVSSISIPLFKTPVGIGALNPKFISFATSTMTFFGTCRITIRHTASPLRYMMSPKHYPLCGLGRSSFSPTTRSISIPTTLLTGLRILRDVRRITRGPRAIPHAISGAISRLRIWTFGEASRTKTISLTWIAWAASSTSDGAMLLSIVSLLVCLRTRTKSTGMASSRISQ